MFKAPLIDATTLAVPPPEQLITGRELLLVPVPLMALLLATKDAERDGELEEEAATVVSGDIAAGIVDEEEDKLVLSLLLISCSITFNCSGVRKLFFVLKTLLLVLLLSGICTN